MEKGTSWTRDNTEKFTNNFCRLMFWRGWDNEGLYDPWQHWLEKNHFCSLLPLWRDKNRLYGPLTTLTWAQIILAACYLWNGTLPLRRDCTDPWQPWPGHTNNSCSLLSLERDTSQGLYGPVTTLTWAQIIIAACYLWNGTLRRDCTDPWQPWPGHK
jgi:hypothetical protein